MSPARGAARVLRTGVFCAAALGLAALAHTLGGGSAPAWPAVGLAMVPVGLMSLWLSSRRRPKGQILGALAVAQIALHLQFHLMHGVAPETLAGPANELRAMNLHAALPPGGSPHDPLRHAVAATHGFGGGLPSARMLAFHVAATLATAWLIGHGEAALWRWAHRLLVRLAPPAPAAWRLPTPRPSAAPLRFSTVMGGGIGLRGPPAPMAG